jgi:hypothetical protein
VRKLAWYLAVAALVAGIAVSADDVTVRNSDKQIKSIVEKISKDQSKFRGALTGSFKDSVVRSSEGEFKVKDFLKDFDTATERVDKRLGGKYSASSEVQQLLQLGEKMHAVVRADPAMKGANEWDVLAHDLNALAMSYGAKFPAETDAPIRRIGDAELEDALAAATKATDGVKSELKKAQKATPALAEKTTNTPAELDSLKKASDALRSRISSGEPATAEARQVYTLEQSIRTALEGAPTAVTTAWTQVTTPLSKVVQAFGFGA